MEEGEAPESALVRELDEELGIDILVGSRLVVHRHSYPFGTVVLTAYAAALRPGEKNEIPHMEDHDAAVWMVPSEWKRYRLSPADLPIAKLVAHRYREI